MIGPYLVLGTLAVVVLASSGAGWAQPAGAVVHIERRSLPAPLRDGGASLATVLATRRSTRVFARRELADHELAQLLWAAQGLTDGHRTALSAGALYPITVRLVDAKGIWRYAPCRACTDPGIGEDAMPCDPPLTVSNSWAVRRQRS